MRSFLILLFSFSFIIASAQTADAQTGKPNFISLNGGFNYPTGDYKDVKLVDTLPAATATQGYYGSVEFGVYFTKHLGLGFNLGGFYNPIDKEKFENQIAEDLKNDAINNADGTASADVNTSEWINVYAMAGPYLTFNIIDKIHLDFKVMAGAMSTNEPMMKINVDHHGTVKLTENKEADVIGLAFNYGMHVRIKLLSKLGLRLNAEGFSSQQQLERAVKHGTWDNTSTKKSHYKQHVTAFNLGVGLVLTFD